MSDHNPPVPPAGTETQPQPQQFPPNRLSPPRLLRLPNGTTTKQYLEHAFKPLRVDESLIRNPNPFTLYIGLWGRTNYVAKTEMGAYRRLENMRRHTGRAPTQPEMDAMLEMMAQSARRSCLGLPLGALAGLAHQAYVLRYSADWEAYFAPQVQETPAGKKVLTLEGFKRGWQMMGDAGAMGGGRPMAAARLFKVAVWTLVADFVASSWATFGEIAMWRGDARLERVREEMERSKHAVRLSTSPGARAISGGDTSEEGQRRRETSAAYALVVAGELREGPSEVDGAGAGDDGSPVAHGMEEDYAFNSGGGRDEHGSRTNSYSEVTPRARAWNTRTQQQQQQRQRQTPSSSGGGDFFDDDDDDASPVAVEHRRRAGGSAWDRLRMNAARPQSRPQQAEWSRAERESESESHSERERAQADFDRMLDAERNAGSDSGRRSGRWSSW